MTRTAAEWAKLVIIPIAAGLIFALGVWLILYLNRLGQRAAQTEDEERVAANAGPEVQNGHHIHELSTRNIERLNAATTTPRADNAHHAKPDADDKVFNVLEGRKASQSRKKMGNTTTIVAGPTMR
jgi:hypothetical protein